jgi:hypothetical protein
MTRAVSTGLRVGALVAGTAAAALTFARTPAPERAWSAQLHVHGSFSEGVGSMDSHVFEAQRVGVDVLWWSDHDYRITASRTLTAFGFEAAVSPFGPGEPWEPRTRREERYKNRLVATEDELSSGKVAHTEPACQGEKSLRVRGANRTEVFEQHMVELETNGGLATRPIAGEVTVRVSVLSMKAGPNAGGVIEVLLSEHPTEGGEILAHRLRYVQSNESTDPRRDGTTLEVPLPFVLGEWNHYELPLTRQVVEGFPELVGEDNSLHRLRFGVRSRGGVPAAVHFDDLRIEQTLSAADAFAKQRELIAAVAAQRADVVQHQGVEVSYLGPHLNEISVAPELLDLDAVFAEGADLDDDALQALYTRRAVEGAHARGGLISLNHFFGAGEGSLRAPENRPDALARLVEARLHGADLIEVGYRDRGGRSLADYLWVWDRLPQHGLFPVGTGVSDSHGGPLGRWDTGVNNWVTWIWAPSTERADLIAGLRAGRAFFGDIVHFDGTLDLVAGEHRMGSLVRTGPDGLEVELRAGGLEHGEGAYFVVDGERLAGITAEGPELREPIRVPRSGPVTVVRAELTTAAGEVMAVSNPIVLVEILPEGVDPSRL